MFAYVTIRASHKQITDISMAERSPGTCYLWKLCKLPGCNEKKWIESDGTMLEFCGKQHAKDFQKQYPSSATRTTTQHSKDDSAIEFYHEFKPYWEFTNFYPSRVTINDQSWPTTEHYFQAQKFIGTPYKQYIQHLSLPSEAFNFSRHPKVNHWLRLDWDSVKDDIMKFALLCKFDQHIGLRDKLLSTGNRKLIEHTSNDSYWGDGGNGKGKNRLGELLMEVRTFMKSKYGGVKSNSPLRGDLLRPPFKLPSTSSDKRETRTDHSTGSYQATTTKTSFHYDDTPSRSTCMGGNSQQRPGTVIKHKNDSSGVSNVLHWAE